jgi:hypothetical protein
MPKYGLALDNLLAADMVMADGRVVRASADENPDLFWAIRGGGGNFGIATSLEYTLHRVGPMITGGVVAHPLPRAFDVLRFFRHTCMSLPDEAMLVAALQTAPDGSNAQIVGIVGGHSGSLEKGAAAFRSLKAFGPPVMDLMGPMPYAALNGMIDPGFPKAALNYWKAQFLVDLTDDAIRTLIAGFHECPSPMSHIIIEHFHGAASRVPVTATACTLRVTGFNVVIASQWMGSSETERGIRWARETFASLGPYLAPTRYVKLSGRRCRRPRRGSVRTEPPAAESDQDEVRPRQFLQTQRQHSAELRPIETPPAIVVSSSCVKPAASGRMGVVRVLCDCCGWWPIHRSPTLAAWQVSQSPQLERLASVRCDGEDSEAPSPSSLRRRWPPMRRQGHQPQRRRRRWAACRRPRALCVFM